ncbi:MAG: ATP-binding protein [Myxococcota bacterium]
MTFVGALSVRWKLIWTSMLTSLIVLALASAAFLAYDLVSFRYSIPRALGTSAQILGLNSAAALLFDDAPAARDLLAALKVDPRIVSASLYTAERRLFVRYVREPAAAPAAAAPFPDEILARPRFRGDSVELARSIEFKGRHAGFVVLESDLSDLAARARAIGTVSALVFVLSFPLALLLTAHFQRVVSGPLLDLVDTVRRISRDQDYALRAEVRSGDELALLVRSFNEMLEQIEQRDDALEAARTGLEMRVEERTKDLEQEIAVRRRTEASLAKQAEELARSNADLEQFAYVASHDLQEPLRMVASYTQLLSETHQGKLGAESDKYIRHAVDGATRMQQLVVDLLAYARVGRASREPTLVDCRSAFDQAVANLEVVVRESNARVTCDELPKVLGHATQFAQLFQNLIGNALKFRGEEPPRIHVDAVRRDGEHVFSVRDNGIGFEAKHAEKIFVIFQRLHARSSRYPGTGMGLALCKKIVETHGGRIWAESTPGLGSTMSFSIPTRDSAAEPEGEGLEDRAAN